MMKIKIPIWLFFIYCILAGIGLGQIIGWSWLALK
jgi:hypothetical protein